MLALALLLLLLAFVVGGTGGHEPPPPPPEPPRPSSWRFAYVVAFNLLLPGALATALTWFVGAAAMQIRHASHAPQPLEWWFAIWFTTYHGLWYLHSWQVHHPWASGAALPTDVLRRYGGLHFFTDLIDVAAVLAAFTLLTRTTPVGETRQLFVGEVRWLWIWAMAMAASALWANYWRPRRRRDLWYHDPRTHLAALGLLAAGLGVGFNWHTLAPIANPALLGAMSLLTVIYGVYVFTYQEPTRAPSTARAAASAR